MQTTPRNPNNLKIAFWNANSVLHKKMEVESFIFENNIDIMLLSETFLRPSHKLTIAKYTTYRYDRTDGPGGGTAILIKRNIKHFEINTPELQHAEANLIMVTTQTGKVRIVSFYSPGARTLTYPDLVALTRSNTPTVIAGDFNAKHRVWNFRTINTNGRTLLKNSNDNGYLVLGPTEPTHFSAGSAPDTIDVAILKNISLHYEISTLQDLSSDHFPVILRLGDAHMQEQNTYSHKRTDWKQYHEYLLQNSSPNPIITCKNDITSAILN